MTVREPTATDSEALVMPLWELPEPKNLWDQVTYAVQSVFYGIVARLVYVLRYYDWRQAANTIAALFAETRSALYMGYWLPWGKEKTFRYYDLNPDTVQTDRPAILLLHGKGSNQSVWVELAKTFKKEGVCNVFTLNTHDGELTDDDIPLIDAKFEEIQKLYGDVDAKIIIIGHSRGAEFSLYAALPQDTFKLEDGYCKQVKEWIAFRPEVHAMIRLGSPLLDAEREHLSEEMLGCIYEIDGMRDLIIPDRSIDPFYQADCGHCELLSDQGTHQKIVQLVRS